MGNGMVARQSSYHNGLFSQPYCKYEKKENGNIKWISTWIISGETHSAADREQAQASVAGPSYWGQLRQN